MPGYNGIRPGLGQRLQYKPAFRHPGVRNAETRRVEVGISVEQHVQIDYPRPPALPSDPPCQTLDVQAPRQKRTRSEHSVDEDHRVQIARLIRTNGSRLPNRRASNDRAVGMKLLDRRTKMIEALTNIGAKTDRDPRIRLPPLRE